MNPDKFTTFLRESGAEILEPTNPYEIVRFRTVNGVSVMYKSKRRYSFTGEAGEAFEKFEHKNIWRIRCNSQKLKEKTMADLLLRDGSSCFFCSNPNELTIEHLLPISDGGNNNMKNLCLACTKCNQAVGNMSIIEKISYRDAVRKP